MCFVFSLLLFWIIFFFSRFHFPFSYGNVNLCAHNGHTSTDILYAIICTIWFWWERTNVIVFRGLFIVNLQVTATLFSQLDAIKTKHVFYSSSTSSSSLACVCVLILPFTLFSCFKTLSTMVGVSVVVVVVVDQLLLRCNEYLSLDQNMSSTWCNSCCC